MPQTQARNGPRRNRRSGRSGCWRPSKKGVTGGKWYSLIDKLYPIATLEAAFAAVQANRGAAGVDHVSIEDDAVNLETNLARLSESLRTGSYRPQAIRRHYIPKPGSTVAGLRRP